MKFTAVHVSPDYNRTYMTVCWKSCILTDRAKALEDPAWVAGRHFLQQLPCVWSQCLRCSQRWKHCPSTYSGTPLLVDPSATWWVNLQLESFGVNQECKFNQKWHCIMGHARTHAHTHTHTHTHTHACTVDVCDKLSCIKLLKMRAYVWATMQPLQSLHPSWVKPVTKQHTMCLDTSWLRILC